MAQCSQCGAAGSSLGGLCQDCIKKKKALQADRLNAWESERRSRFESPFGILFQEHGGKIILGLTLVFFVMYQRGVFGWGSIPNISLPAASEAEDPCKIKKQCLIAYVAPWCPSCHSAVPFLNALAGRLATSPNTGMKVVIGMADSDQLKNMASLFSAPVFYDLNGALASGIGIYSVPNVTLVAADGKILEKGLPGGISGGATMDDDVTYYIENILKL